MKLKTIEYIVININLLYLPEVSFEFLENSRKNYVNCI